MTRRAPWLALVAGLLACGDDTVMAGPDTGVDGADSTLPTGPVVTTYDGDRPPRGGFCDAAGDVVDLDMLPFTTLLDTQTVLVDHARPSTACTVSSASVAPDFVFTFTPPELGTFTMRADLPSTDPWIDTVLYVRSGCDGDGEELACNDDNSSTSGPSRLAVEVPSGVPLFALVDGFAELDVGEIEVTFDFVPSPPPSDVGGDTCDAATELVFSGDGDTRIAMAMGDTEGASNDSGCDGVRSTRDLPDQFYGFTLVDTRDVLVSVDPDDEYDPAFYVLSACGGGEAVACHDSGPPGFTEALTLEALPAGRYIIGVDAFEHPTASQFEQGSYVLQVVATVP